MKKYLSLFLMLLFGKLSFAQNDKSYKEVAAERAEKIVGALNIQDSKKSDKIKRLVAEQYISLNKIHNDRDDLLKKSPDNSLAVKSTSEKEVATLHVAYLKKLSKELNKEQIDEVKNGMTYHTVPLTYANYLLMLPYLTVTEKDSVLFYLNEGRERAMDGGTSKEKHAWFNNCKGKIANYLSAKGYQLKFEGEEWAKRRDLKSSSLEVTTSNRVVTALGLNDRSKQEIVRNLVAYQYQQIQKIQAEKIKAAEGAKNLSKEAADKVNQKAWEESKLKLDNQRALFNNELSKFVNKDQLELVKNEMTDQGLKKEYDKFQALLPQLTTEHKNRIYEYLLEARENALNVLTSRERNQWFAKYRGRANNYLSAQGYDLRKATEELERKQN